MPKATNKLYSRAQIRSELRVLYNNVGHLVMSHRDACRHDPNHVESTCAFCRKWLGQLEGIERAIRYFGGRA